MLQLPRHGRGSLLSRWHLHKDLKPWREPTDAGACRVTTEPWGPTAAIPPGKNKAPFFSRITGVAEFSIHMQGGGRKADQSPPRCLKFPQCAFMKPWTLCKAHIDTVSMYWINSLSQQSSCRNETWILNYLSFSMHAQGSNSSHIHMYIPLCTQIPMYRERNEKVTEAMCKGFQSTDDRRCSIQGGESYYGPEITAADGS